MDLKRLELFCRVVELKSFTRAAESVRLTQPTVSEAIRLLEQGVDETLLDRQGRQVLPTPAGKLLYRYARRLLQLRDEAGQALADLRGELRGPLLLGASTIPGAYLLPGLLERLRLQAPELAVRLKIAGTGQVLEELRQERLELALVGGRTQERGFDWQPSFGDELVLVVPPGHAWAGRQEIAPERLLEQSMLLREPGSGTRSVVEEGLRQLSIDPGRLPVVAEIGSSEAVKQSVRAGLGIAFLSDLAVAAEVARGELSQLRLTGCRLQRSFYLVQRRGRSLSPVAEVFRTLVLAK